MSSPAPSVPALLRTVSPAGYPKKTCTPPPPVRAPDVSGPGPSSRSRGARLPGPPAPAPGAAPRRLGDRTVLALEEGEALEAAVPRVCVQHQQAAAPPGGDADVGRGRGAHHGARPPPPSRAPPGGDACCGRGPAAPPGLYPACLRGGVPETVAGERPLAAR